MRDTWIEVIRNAEARFWEALADGTPDINTGDIPPHVAAEFTKACEKAARAWYHANRTTGAASASCQMVVQMVVELRPPTVGERGIWIKDHHSPESALAEVLQIWEDDHEVGWLCNHEFTDNDEVDDEGLRVATILFRKLATQRPCAWCGRPYRDHSHQTEKDSGELCPDSGDHNQRYLDPDLSGGAP